MEDKAKTFNATTRVTIGRRILKLRNERKQSSQKLKVLQTKVKSAKKTRAKNKEKLVLAGQIDPKLLPKGPGRPRLDSEQNGLLDAIISIATANESKVAADPRRRSEQIRSYMRLDDLHKALCERKFNISRSATYLRLLPRRSASHQGKKHVVTVPVRLCKPQNDHYDKHPDADFCFSLVNDLNYIASILGPDECIFISPDDKAIVKLGIIAAKYQTAMVMHMEYKLRLPNHDFIVATKHHLIPSIYAFLTVKPNSVGQTSSVSYTGPTAAYIRSGKHDQSNALTHRLDLTDIFESKTFGKFTHNDRGMKRVLILRSDNGPDEAPRNPSTQSEMIQLFLKFRLVALFLISLPAGYSPFSPCERRMAPLSKQLTGVVLDHQHYGSHLNSSRETIDDKLELKNFQNAGERLAHLFADMKYDNCKTVAQYVKPPKDINARELHDKDKPIEVTEQWKYEHVQASKYCFQVVCCDDPSCCSDRPDQLKAVLRPLLPNGFIPPPTKLEQHFSKKGGLPLEASKEHLLNKSVNFASLSTRALYPLVARTPFDHFCPSLQEKLSGIVCDKCFKAFPSKSQMLVHRRALHKFERYQKVRVDELLQLEHDEKLSQIECIIKHLRTTKEYQAVFVDGTVDWITIINDHHQKVKEYFERKRVNMCVFDADKADWMERIWENE